MNNRNFAQIYLSRYVTQQEYLNQVAQDVNLHQNRTRFHHVDISMEQFDSIYDSTSWGGRKLSALPLIAWNVCVIAINNIAIPLIKALICWDIEVFAEETYIQARRLQDCLGLFITIFNDRLGQYICAHAKINISLHKAGYALNQKYKELKGKIEAGDIEYHQLLKDVSSEALMSDIELFNLANENRTSQQVIENYKKAPTAIRENLEIAQKLWRSGLDVYKWLPDSMRYDDAIANQAYNYCSKNVRFASLAFQRAHGYDPVSFAIADQAAVKGMGTGAYYLTQDPNGQANAYRMHMKLDLKNSSGEKLSFFRSQTIKIINDEIIIEGRNGAKNRVYKSFNDLKKELEGYIYKRKSDSYFLKYKQSQLWLLPANDPQKLSDQDVLNIFNTKVFNPQNGLYKISKKYTPLSSSKYIYVKNNESKVYDYIHGASGLLGKGAFSIYKKAQGQNDVLAVGVPTEKSKASRIQPKENAQFVSDCIKASRHSPLPFIVPRDTIRISDAQKSTKVTVAPALYSDARAYLEQKCSNTTTHQQIQMLSRVFYGMAEATYRLHKLGYAHGDVKPVNFLVNKERVESSEWSKNDHGSFLCDFDGVTHQSEKKLPNYWSRYYAPKLPRENFKSLAQTVSADRSFKLNSKLDAFALLVSFTSSINDMSLNHKVMPEEWQDTLSEYHSIIDRVNGISPACGQNLEKQFNALVPDVSTLINGSDSLIGLKDLIIA